jgi:hypothetical protein
MALQDASNASQSDFGSNCVGSAVVPCPFADTHWIEIVLLDEVGQPLAGERFVVVKPDGSKAEGTLDANGRARLDGIDPGTCDVTFPALHERGWPGRESQAAAASGQ